MSKFYGKPMEFVFEDRSQNETIILEGHLLPISVPNGTRENVLSTTPKPTFLESNGPLIYVITVILVYGLSMFLIVGTLLRKKSRNTLLDREVTRYMRGIVDAQRTAMRESVLRTRLRWPGNHILPRFNARHPLESDKESCGSPAPLQKRRRSMSENSRFSVHVHAGDNSFNEIKSDTSDDDNDSCVTLPAITITPVVELQETSTNVQDPDQNLDLAQFSLNYEQETVDDNIWVKRSRSKRKLPRQNAVAGVHGDAPKPRDKNGKTRPKSSSVNRHSRVHFDDDDVNHSNSDYDQLMAFREKRFQHMNGSARVLEDVPQINVVEMHVAEVVKADSFEVIPHKPAIKITPDQIPAIFKSFRRGARRNTQPCKVNSSGGYQKNRSQTSHHYASDLPHESPMPPNDQLATANTDNTTELSSSNLVLKPPQDIEEEPSQSHTTLTDFAGILSDAPGLVSRTRSRRQFPSQTSQVEEIPDASVPLLNTNESDDALCLHNSSTFDPRRKYIPNGSIGKSANQNTALNSNPANENSANEDDIADDDPMLLAYRKSSSFKKRTTGRRGSLMPT